MSHGRHGRTFRRMNLAGSFGVRPFAAVTSGFVLALAFPGPWSSQGWSYLAIPAITVSTLAFRGVSGRRAALLAVVFALVFFGVTLTWLNVIGPDAWAALVLLSAILTVPIGPIIAWTSRSSSWPVFAAASWVLVEAIRSRIPFGGFSWARLAFATPGTPMARIGSIGGAPLVSFAVALAGTLLAAGLINRRPTQRLVLIGAALAIVGAGLAIPTPTNGEHRGGAATATVALIQGNVARPGIDFLGRPELVLTMHVQETIRLADDINHGRALQPDFVVWPENASDIDPLTVADARNLIDTAAQTIDRPVLVGAVLTDPTDSNRLLNAGVVWDPATGPGAQYVKQHLVPFGEYVPFRSELAKWISRFNRVPRDFAPGQRPGVLSIAGIKIGDVICFEIAYDQIPTETIRRGARLLVVQTNNATYGATTQPDQQLAISRLRAIEHGRTVVIASTSGISAVVAPDGRVVARAATFTPAYIDRVVALRDSITFADRVGQAPEFVLVITPLIGLAMSWRRRRLRSEQESEEEVTGQ